MIYRIILPTARKNIFTRCAFNFINIFSPVSYALDSNKTLSQKQNESGAGLHTRQKICTEWKKKTLSLVTFPCIYKTDLCDFI